MSIDCVKQQNKQTDLKDFADRLMCKQIAENDDPARKTDTSDETQCFAPHPQHGVTSGTGVVAESGALMYRMADWETGNTNTLMSCLMRLAHALGGDSGHSFGDGEESVMSDAAVRMRTSEETGQGRR